MLYIIALTAWKYLLLHTPGQPHGLVDKKTR